MMASYNVAHEGGRLARLSRRLFIALSNPINTLSHLKKTLLNIETDTIYAKSPIPTITFNEVVAPTAQITLQSIYSQDGNTSYLEMLCLAGGIATHQPKSVLEIGTFDGNSTLQMALNLPKGGILHTLDLPHEISETKLPITEADIAYTHFSFKRKYLDTSIEHSVIQHFGDSTAIDFATLNKGKKFDFIFIDGGHSFECIENDTEKSLNYLNSGGMIFWHDYSPYWPGVCRFLDKLSKKIHLRRVEGTTLVCHISQQLPTQNST